MERENMYLQCFTVFEGSKPITYHKHKLLLEGAKIIDYCLFNPKGP